LRSRKKFAPAVRTFARPRSQFVCASKPAVVVSVTVSLDWNRPGKKGGAAGTERTFEKLRSCHCP
jgi:hypothetical protein